MRARPLGLVGAALAGITLAAIGLSACSPAAAPDDGTLHAMTPDEAAALAPVGAPIEAVLTSAPNVPPATGRHEPATVVVHLAVKEVQKEIAKGATYTFWTFGGDVPGKFIRVRQGDTVEFHLQNDPASKLPHNIDLHAVSGPGGGATSSLTAPGHESTFNFKALNAGLYVYHCATSPVGMHIGNGMYGMILVEPPEGLPPVDKEFYVMQGDFYTEGATDAPGNQPFAWNKAVDENPTYVLFDGKEGALVGDGALHAEVGEKVRIFFGNGGPNLTSSYHVIGAVFDRVYSEGGLRPQYNVQTTVVPPGGGAIVEFTPRVPGTYTMVDHAIFRAFNKGAVGQLVVTGPENPAVYSNKKVSDTPYVPPAAPATDDAAPAAATAPAAPAAPADAELGQL